MTQDEIIEMAQECKLIVMRPHLDGIYFESLVAFANLVAAKEREALAQHDSVQAKTEPEQEPVAWMYQEYRDDDQFGWRDEIAFIQPPNDPIYFRNIKPVCAPTPQRTPEERNFCPRCGKRCKSAEDIHTCTPPKPEQEPVAWKLMPRDATDAMLKAMDECSTEGYDERLYAGHAASVYMAAWDEAPETIPKKKWVGLTEEEHTQIAIDAGCMSADWVFYSAFIERKLREKNT